MRTIAIGDPGRLSVCQLVSMSVCQAASRSFAVQTRLNGSRSCLDTTVDTRNTAVDESSDSPTDSMRPSPNYFCQFLIFYAWRCSRLCRVCDSVVVSCCSDVNNKLVSTNHATGHTKVTGKAWASKPRPSTTVVRLCRSSTPAPTPKSGRNLAPAEILAGFLKKCLCCLTTRLN